jgi:hypothetical protein
MRQIVAVVHEEAVLIHYDLLLNTDVCAEISI